MSKENPKLIGYEVLHPIWVRSTRAGINDAKGIIEPVYYSDNSKEMPDEENINYFINEDLDRDFDAFAFVKTEEEAKQVLNEMCDSLINKLNKIKESIK